MLKLIKKFFASPDIKVWENEEGLYQVARIQTRFSFYYEIFCDILVYCIVIYFVVNHSLGNFVLVWK